MPLIHKSSLVLLSAFQERHFALHSVVIIISHLQQEICLNYHWVISKVTYELKSRTLSFCFLLLRLRRFGTVISVAMAISLLPKSDAISIDGLMFCLRLISIASIFFFSLWILLFIKSSISIWSGYFHFKFYFVNFI